MVLLACAALENERALPAGVARRPRHRAGVPEKKRKRDSKPLDSRLFAGPANAIDSNRTTSI
jgi:hypothetical protein